jgi:hypothetical protein
MESTPASGGASPICFVKDYSEFIDTGYHLPAISKNARTYDLVRVDKNIGELTNDNPEAIHPVLLRRCINKSG